MDEYTLLYRAFSVGPGQSVRLNDLLKKKTGKLFAGFKKVLTFAPANEKCTLSSVGRATDS